VEESFPPEHGSELFGDSLEKLLNGGGVADKCGRHLQTTRRDVTDSRLHIVGDPLHEVGGVLVLNVQHLFVHLLHGHAATEDCSHCQISAHKIYIYISLKYPSRQIGWQRVASRAEKNHIKFAN
jgi:hypothetical protein